MNQHIEGLVFEARTVEGNVPIHLHFHDISQTNTTDDVFYYDNGVNTPVACQYHTLHLLTLEDVFEAGLPAVKR
jgi:hypothetical protein